MIGLQWYKPSNCVTLFFRRVLYPSSNVYFKWHKSSDALSSCRFPLVLNALFTTLFLLVLFSQVRLRSTISYRLACVYASKIWKKTFCAALTKKFIFYEQYLNSILRIDHWGWMKSILYCELLIIIPTNIYPAIANIEDSIQVLMIFVTSANITIMPYVNTRTISYNSFILYNYY